MQPETPCLIVDTSIMRNNIQTMADKAKPYGVHLRPHAKTHKLPSIAREQMDAGAIGITVAKISEAEVMANHGIDNIFVAYPLVTESKIERTIQLSRRIHLIVGVDSYVGATQLSVMAQKNNCTLHVRLEIDTGLKRTGAQYEQALQLAQYIQGLASLQLDGIFTFRGALLDGLPTLDLQSAGIQEGTLMVKLADEMRAQGIPIHEVSVGSTPTGIYAAAVKGITEIRPGTYVFYDQMQTKLGVSALSDCAAHIMATVISRPSAEYAIIDGGSKTFATDVQPGTHPLQLQGFGYILEEPGAVLERLSEEHGILRLSPQSSLQIGDRIRIIPNHICSTLNLHNQLYFKNSDQFTEHPILARGMLE
ncbi:alanine racemase [Paenibacillus sp. N3.4]|uniref:alanine racemase n=1 Tax=Paenibacillus sp. N3.4 TaxID=2603222 RepID=UPI0011CA30C4|nr:alanine racemase [Paenibacillus sp. N3.4]TXK85285.1 amino acid aldolase [Paenibacillus sp. N3.4]